MISVTQQTESKLRQMLLDAFAQAAKDGSLPDCPPAEFIVEVPGDTTKGDFATNAAMVNARTMRSAPAKIAAALVSAMNTEGTDVERVEVAGPGFINFFMKPQWFGRILSEVREKGDDYGRSTFGNREKVMVEFVSANPTGPMHMGNARGGAIGDCLAEAMDWAGYDVTREFYVNDAGNQIEKFAVSLEVRYLQLYQGEDALELPENAYHGADIIEHAKAFAAIYGDKYVDADSRERKDALVAFALPKNIQKLHEDLGRYRINYDVWFHESTLHPQAVEDVIRMLTDRGYTYEKDGAIWYKATAFGAEKDDVLVRANGISTYFAADIAYHYNKFAVRGFDRVINVWGADHHGHVARLKGAMDALGLQGDKLDIVLMQLVRLMKNGEPYRMSKRSGNAVTLSDLLDEVPLDAARFFFIMREPGSTLDFDLDLAVEQSAQNPVFYVQYAHARICSLLKNLAAEGYQPGQLSEEALAILTAPEERELIRRLGQLPQEIVGVAKHYDPAKLSSYCTDVATLFHKFYTACRVKGEEEQILKARLCLCDAARIVLRNTLSLLKITAPEVM